MAEQVAKLETTEQVAQSSADKAKQAAADAKTRAEAIAHETLPKLERPLPTVELAERMQSRSEEGLKQIAEQLKQLSNQAQSLQTAQPERQRLAEAAQMQPRVEADVADVAEDMARAARHQQRLGENELAKTTADAAAAVKQLRKVKFMKRPKLSSVLKRLRLLNNLRQKRCRTKRRTLIANWENPRTRCDNKPKRWRLPMKRSMRRVRRNARLQNRLPQLKRLRKQVHDRKLAR